MPAVHIEAELVMSEFVSGNHSSKEGFSSGCMQFYGVPVYVWQKPLTVCHRLSYLATCVSAAEKGQARRGRYTYSDIHHTGILQSW